MLYLQAFLIIAIIPTVIYFFYQYCQFVIAKKLGHPLPWLAFVPFANNYQIVQLAEKPLWWAHIIVAPIAVFLMSLIPGLELIGTVLFMVSMVVSLVFFLMSIFSLSKKRGKSSLFAWGSVCAYYAFFPVLAFSDVSYEAHKEITVKKSLSNYLQIVRDLCLPYENFFHWNATKVVYSVYSILASILLSLPFLYIAYYSNSYLENFGKLNITDVDKISSFIIGNIFWVSVYFISLSIVVAIFLFFFSYLFIFIQKIYHEYIDGKISPIFKNGYWSWTLMKKFIGVLSWQTLYLLGSITVCLVLSVILAPVITGMAQAYIADSDSSGLKTTLFIFAVIIFLPAIYMALRTNFAYNLLLDSADIDQKTEHYVNQSLDMTRGNLWSLILLSAPFLIILAIVGEAFTYIQNLFTNNWLGLIIWIISMFIIGGLSLMVNVSIYRIFKKSQ